MNGQSDDSLLTPEMEQAERELDARIDYALGVGHEVQERVERFERRLDEDKEPPTDEDVERIKAFVLGHARTEEWQKVIERIDRGELTWRKVVEDLSSGQLDREVSAAFASLSKVPPASLDELIESGVVPADAAGEAEEENEAAEEPQSQDDGAGRYFQATQDDEEWLDDNPTPWRSF